CVGQVVTQQPRAARRGVVRSRPAMTAMDLELHQLDLRHEALRIADPASEARLAASIVAHGQLSPVWVVADADRDGQFIVVDGFRRVRALRVLHRDTVAAVASPLDQTAALIHVYRIASGRPRTALEDAWLIEELLGTSKLSHSTIGVQLGRT